MTAGRRYALFVGAFVLAVVGGFAVVELTGPALLVAPDLSGAALPTAALGVGLLVADVLIPVPSSIVMTAFGAVFGFWPAVALSWAAATAATMVGYGVGRVGARRVRPPLRLERLLDRWGAVAVALTRPLPVLAETVAVLAGTSATLGWRKTFVGAAVGAVPAAVVYAAAGDLADDAVSGVAVIPLVLVIAGLLWLAERRWLRVQHQRDISTEEEHNVVEPVA